MIFSYMLYVKVMDICKFGCVKKIQMLMFCFIIIYVVYQFVCLIFYVLNSIKIDENVLSIDFKDKISCLNFFSSEFYYVCYSVIILICGFLMLKLKLFCS